MKKMIVAAVIVGVAAATVWYLAGSGPSPETVSAELRKLISKQDAGSRESIQKLTDWGPCVIAPIREFCSAVEEPVIQENADKRAAAVQVLTGFYENQEACDCLIELSRSSDAYVKREAITALGYQWGDGVLEALEAVINEPELELKVFRPDPGAGEGRGRWYSYRDFDDTATDALKQMKDVYSGSMNKPDRVKAVDEVLERAATGRLGSEEEKASGLIDL
ncbi:MAG: HEAT repeat domain-containing protein [Planctomycetes bacterium]|nr:HEAT repeat domain-containing protein [Planctomycetota bacterium]